MSAGNGLPPEEKDRLQTLLDQLHDELGRAGAVDESLREKLETLVADTRALLEKGTRPEEPGSLQERLTDILAQYEGAHPTLAYVMGRIIEALSGLGI